MAEAVGRAAFELHADTGPLKRDLDQADQSVKRIGASTETAFKGRVGGAFGGLRTQIGGLKKEAGGFSGLAKTGFGMGLGLGAFSLATGAISGVVDMLGNAVQSAKEEEVGIVRLGQALKNNVAGFDGNTDAIEKTIASREKLAFSDDDLRDSLGSLVTRTHDVGKAMDLQALAMDLARAKGIGLVQASQIVGKVQGGNVGVLARYGIAVQKGATATEALGAIQKATAGQAQAFANSSEGAGQAAAIAMGDVAETIGGALLPVVANLGRFLVDVLIPGFASVIGVVGQVVGALSPLFTIFGNVASVVGTVLVGAFTAVGNVLNALAPAFTAIGEIVGTVFTGVADVVKGVVSNIIGAVRNIIDIAAQIPGPFQGAASAMRDTLTQMQADVQAWGTTTQATAGATPPAAAAAIAAGGPGMTAASDAVFKAPATSMAAGKKAAVAIALLTPGAVADSLMSGRDAVGQASDALTGSFKNSISKTKEIANLEGKLTGDRLASALKSKDPIIRARGEAYKATVEERLWALKHNVPEIAAKTGMSYADALAYAKRHSRAAADQHRREVAEKLTAAARLATPAGRDTGWNYGSAVGKQAGNAGKKAGAVKDAATGALNGSTAAATAGSATIGAYIGAIGSTHSISRAIAAASSVTRAIGGVLRASSPPRHPLNALRDIDKMGERTMMAYGDGGARAAGYVARQMARVTNIGPGAGAALAPTLAMPSLARPQPALGGAVHITIHYQHNPLVSTATPGEMLAASRALQPAIVASLRQAGITTRGVRTV